MVPIDITGVRYGRLIGIERVRLPGERHTKWRFACDCGATLVAALHHVRSGRQVSCGCYRDEEIASRSLRHGSAIGRKATVELAAWSRAKSRCFNERDPKYAEYGGRGITMCERWADDSVAFLTDMGPRPRGMTLDRIDVDGNYEPANCRWATARTQVNNRRVTLFVTVSGAKIPLGEYADISGVPYKTLYTMLKRGELA